ncbi:hypothetical protein SCHPADRAFT_709354 [Schizopora paradoxa]|uniref:Uncharacterized protein n=1 Tax=Schizopora paradoxa TaxID=27342 RepID=A0A0H2R8K3_9AGAM|nr:hypothetical protein SCHPADRAFT_709354 [Schizopora paradoxa]
MADANQGLAPAQNGSGGLQIKMYTGTKSDRACNPCASMKRGCNGVSQGVCDRCRQGGVACYWPCLQCKKKTRKCTRSDEVATCSLCKKLNVECIPDIGMNGSMISNSQGAEQVLVSSVPE